MNLPRRTVLITGGSQGIGFATAEKSLAEGCRLILIARDLGKLEAAKVRLEAAGHAAADIHLAVGDMADCDALPDLVSRLPWIAEGLWGLVLNAAVEILKPAREFTSEEILTTLKVNVVAPILMIQSTYAALQACQGSVVYVGSIADFKRDAGYSVYGGSKAFMKAFVGHAAQETGWDGVRINLVSPGATDTELMRRMRDEEKAWPEDQMKRFVESIPMEQRMGRPDEMADAVWFALSGPRYFHGEDLRIYGGHK